MTVLGQVRTDFGALMKLVAWSLVTSPADVRPLTFWRVGFGLTGVS